MPDWTRVKSIFEEIVELPEKERGAVLDAHCDGDAGLRAAVMELLEANDRAGAFLNSPTLDSAVAAGSIARGTGELPARVGPYTPVELIGEGGFGTVYRARQETPVRREVALKLIKAGMDTREVVARFERERQALALMNHPNIAGVLDAGETAERRPYFVMEFVPGEPITAWCERRGVGVEERLRLIVQVSHAVQHAHQKGVIHRDIKPSNILVTEQDGVATPKVIDFGVAKATEQRLGDRTMQTQHGVLVGTPAYMSPEQADLRYADIDTRTDVYSLGVLLYELLSGGPPFSMARLVGEGQSDFQRIICEVEPPRPSTAAAERGRPAELVRALRGDLDWIVMKCLEKDRARRYESASALAQDIERYLGSEPVLARPPTIVYRVRKFARRNRAAFVAISGIAIALTLGLAVSIAGFVTALRALGVANRERDVADEQRRLAQSAAERSEAIQRFLQDMLLAADPKFSGQRDITVRQALDRAVARLDAGALDDQPELAAAVRVTVSRTYAGLAQYAAAERQVEQALTSMRQRGVAGTPDHAAALQQRGEVLHFTGRWVDAEADFRTALEILKRRGSASAAIASCQSDLANSIASQGRGNEAEPLQREAVEWARLPENSNLPIRAEAVNNLGGLYLAQGDWSASEPYFREAIEVNERLFGRVHPNLATNLDNLAQALAGQGNAAGAESAYLDALEIRRKLYGKDHPDVAVTLHNLAVLEFERGDRRAAETALRESLDILERTHGPTYPDSLVVVESLVSVLGSEARLDECEPPLLRAFEAIRDSDVVPAARKHAFALRLMQLYEAWSKPEQAAEWRETARRLSATSQPSSSAVGGS